MSTAVLLMEILSHSWSVAREVQSIPTKCGQILAEERAEDISFADISGSDCEPVVVC